MDEDMTYLYLGLVHIRGKVGDDDLIRWLLACSGGNSLRAIGRRDCARTRRRRSVGVTKNLRLPRVPSRVRPTDALGAGGDDLGTTKSVASSGGAPQCQRTSSRDLSIAQTRVLS